MDFSAAQAIVVARRERREADMRIDLFTREFGLIRATAQGIRKAAAKLRGHLEFAASVDILFVQGRSGYRLTSAALVDARRGLRSSPEAYRAALAGCEIISAVSFEGEDGKSWALLAQFLDALAERGEQAAAESETILYWFLAQILAVHGYHASLDVDAARTIRLKQLLQSFENVSVVEALERPLAYEARAVVAASLRRSFEDHFGHSFSFLRPTRDGIIDSYSASVIR